MNIGRPLVPAIAQQADEADYGGLAPDHKTIADFHKGLKDQELIRGVNSPENGPAIRKVCARFVALCRQFGLLAEASVVIDGAKFKAVNTRDKNFTAAKMKRRLEQRFAYLVWERGAYKDWARGHGPAKKPSGRSPRVPR